MKYKKSILILLIFLVFIISPIAIFILLHSDIYSFRDISFLPDGKTILSVSGGTISSGPLLLNLDKKKREYLPPFKQRGFFSSFVSVSSNGSYASTWGFGGFQTVVLYDLSLGEIIFSHPGDSSCFSPDGNKLIIARNTYNKNEDGEIYIFSTEIIVYDIKHKKFLAKMKHSDKLNIAGLISMACFIDNKRKERLVVKYPVRSDNGRNGMSPAEVRIYDLNLNEIKKYRISGVEKYSRVFATQMGIFVFKSDSFGIMEIDPQTDNLKEIDIDGFSYPNAQISKNGSLIAFSTGQGDDQVARIWSINQNRKVRDISISEFPIQCIAFSPKDRYLAVGSRFRNPESGQLNIYSIGTGELVDKVHPFAEWLRLWIHKKVFLPIYEKVDSIVMLIR